MEETPSLNAPDGAQEASLSIEETNKLRIKLGLRPLDVTKAGSDKNQLAEQRYEDLKQQRLKDAAEKKARQRLEDAKLKLELETQAKSKSGLGAAGKDDDELMDTKKWISKLKKISKKPTIVESATTSTSKQVYKENISSTDLPDITVGHDLSSFVEGEERVLVLQDAPILGGDSDDKLELINVDLLEQEKTQRNIENKKRKPVYLAFDDEEFINPGQKRSLLSQYDEVIEGEKKKGFVLKMGINTPSVPNVGAAAAAAAAKDNSNGWKSMPISLAPMPQVAVRDYLTPEEADALFVKKARKKKPRRSNNAKQEEEEITMPKAPTKLLTDDDELQAALSRARRWNVRDDPAAMVDPEEAKFIQHLQKRKPMVDRNEGGDGLVISETTEFIESLKALAESEELAPDIHSTSAPNVVVEEAEAGEIQQQISEQVMTRLKVEAESENEQEEEEIDEEKELGFINEPLIKTGVGATLQLLRQKGLVEESKTEGTKDTLENLKWINQKRKLELRADRERDEFRSQEKKLRQLRAEGRKKKMTPQEEEMWREHEKEVQRKERERQREQERLMRDYKPDVQLRYVDKYGRDLDPKEAYRDLSHRFHGKSSGKKKTEKRFQKYYQKLEAEEKLKGHVFSGGYNEE